MIFFNVNMKKTERLISILKLMTVVHVYQIAFLFSNILFMQ